MVYANKTLRVQDVLELLQRSADHQAFFICLMDHSVIAITFAVGNVVHILALLLIAGFSMKYQEIAPTATLMPPINSVRSQGGAECNVGQRSSSNRITAQCHRYIPKETDPIQHTAGLPST